MNREEILAVLSASKFGGIDRDALNAIALLVAEVTLQPGALLFGEGDLGSEAFFVLDGEVEIVRRTAAGEHVVNVVSRSGFMGELALYGAGVRTATARARTDARLAALTYHQFLEVIRTWPEFATTLLRIQTSRFAELEQKYLALIRVA
jgi:CRP-like cAMP-binding protein